MADMVVIASKSEHILEGFAPYRGAAGAEGAGPLVLLLGVGLGRVSIVQNNRVRYNGWNKIFNQ